MIVYFHSSLLTALVTRMQVLLLSVATAYLQALRGFHSGSTNMAQRTVGGALRLALFGGTAALRLTGATAKFLLLAMLD